MAKIVKKADVLLSHQVRRWRRVFQQPANSTPRHWRGVSYLLPDKSMKMDNRPEGIMNEADTCRVLVTPKLKESGWDTPPFGIGEQRIFTNGRIIVSGGKVRRGKQKKVDYLLYYRRDLPIAVVEAKDIGEAVETGVQQAKDYAETLGLKFAYATNGKRIIEIDYLSGTETELEKYPSPEELWQRLNTG